MIKLAPGKKCLYDLIYNNKVIGHISSFRIARKFLAAQREVYA